MRLRTKIILALFVSIVLVLALRPNWVHPVPGVVLTPRRPILQEEDVEPGSAYGLMVRAGQFPAGLKEFDVHYVFKRCLDVGLPPDWVSIAPAETLVEPEDDQDGDPLDPEGFFSDLPPYAPPLPWKPREIWPKDEVPRLKCALSLMEPNFELARKAVLQPDPQVPTSLRAGRPWSVWMSTLLLHRWLYISACSAAAYGDWQRCYADSMTAIRISDALMRGGETFLYGCGAREIEATCMGIWRLTHRSRSIPVSPTLELVRDLGDIERSLEPLAEAYRYDALKYAARPGHLFEDLWEAQCGWKIPFVLRLLYQSSRVLGGSTNRRIRRNIHAFYQHFIDAAEADDVNRVRTFVDGLWGPGARTAPTFPSYTWLFWPKDPAGQFCAYQLLEGWEHYHWQNTFQAERLLRATLRLTRGYLAARAYQEVHGRPPDRLTDLVPDFIEAVPLDPYSGDPVRYRPGDSGEWVLYVVGPDGKDDAGPVDHVRDTVFGSGGYLWLARRDLAMPGQAPVSERVVQLLRAIADVDTARLEDLLTEPALPVSGRQCEVAASDCLAIHAEREVQSLGPTPLMLAVILGRVEHARMLLAGGADPNAQYATGQRILMIDHTARPDGIRRIQAYFRGDSGALGEKWDDVKRPCEEASHQAPSAPLAADALLPADVLPAPAAAVGHIRARLGCCGPLHVAAWMGSVKMVSLLVENGADVNDVTHVGCTPLHFAVTAGRTETIAALLAHGADADIEDAVDGYTPPGLANLLRVTWPDATPPAEVTE